MVGFIYMFRDLTFIALIITLAFIMIGPNKLTEINESIEKKLGNCIQKDDNFE